MIHRSSLRPYGVVCQTSVVSHLRGSFIDLDIGIGIGINVGGVKIGWFYFDVFLEVNVGSAEGRRKSGVMGFESGLIHL